MLVAAIDPGRNIGYALVSGEGRLLEARIMLAEELTVWAPPEDAVVVVGDGTGSGAIEELLLRRGLQPALVGEEGTSLEGRDLYFRDHPPGCLMRLLPRGLWSPPRPIDDYAAYAIALRYLEAGTEDGRLRDESSPP